MTDYEMLTAALRIARAAHKTQTDKGGDEYIYHPITVALLCETIDEKIVALLHDVLEDNKKYTDEVYALFPKHIIDALKLVTHIPDKTISDATDEYKSYIRNLKSSGNKTAISVKIADLTNNTDISRINGIKPPKYDTYLWALDYLKNGISSH